MTFEPDQPQQIVIDHLRSVNDALLLVSMGLGKTAMCLYRLRELFLSAESIGALVIAPLRVTNLTWPLEAKQWQQFSWMRVVNLRTQSGQRAFLNGGAHLYTINWDAMNLLVRLVELRGDKPLPYDVVIFDELTKAKSPSSKRVNLFRRKVPRVDRHWGLTGTFVPNSWLDVFAQVRLVDGGQRLGTNYLQFKKDFFFAPSTPFQPWKAKAETEKTLEGKISDITVTLKSSDWLDIPDTIFEDVEVHFTPELRKKYETLEEKLIIELRKDRVMNVANAAALVTKLLQFTSGHMYDEEKEVHPIHNLKFEALAHIAKKEKQPLLVATIYKHEQDRIRAQFPQAVFFNDAKNAETQTQLLHKWNDGKIPMLVAHPASVGHGLNLQHGSSIIVWITLTYSRELYEQMIARLARRGQEKVITVYRIMVPGTVDDAVAEALETKAANEARLISALQLLESYRNQK